MHTGTELGSEAALYLALAHVIDQCLSGVADVSAFAAAARLVSILFPESLQASAPRPDHKPPRQIVSPKTS